LLNERYQQLKVLRDAMFEDLIKKGIGITLTTDGATISKRPLSNVCAAIPHRGAELITYDDATEHMQNGGKKDARYYALLLVDAIDELGPQNVCQVVTDNASVMLAFWEELQPLYPWIFFSGCLAHKANTFVKKICDIALVNELIQNAKKVIQHFSAISANQAVLKKHCLVHLKSELAFIIPAETRFGLFLLMLHRIAIMKPAIQGAACDPSFTDDVDITANVMSVKFWVEVKELIQYLMPVLRFIRFADSDGEIISLVYSRARAIDEHLNANVDSVSSMPGVANEIVALFAQESKDWNTDLHKTMHVLNPSYSAEFSNPVLQLAVKNVLKQYFSDPEKQARALAEILKFVDREGEYGELMVKAAMDSVEPSKFFRLHGTSTPLLQEICVRFHPQVISSSCSERNWKQYKDIRSKRRSKLGTSTVEKLVLVQSSLIAEENELENNEVQIIRKWKDVDLIATVSETIQRSFQKPAQEFNNFIEPWEHSAISTELVGNEIRLLNKYKNICIQDDDPVFTGRVVGIEWKKRKGSSPAGYYLVTADVEGETDKDKIEYWPYQINEILHDLIKACPSDLNSSFSFSNTIN
jgi:hypothetical protein